MYMCECVIASTESVSSFMKLCHRWRKAWVSPVTFLVMSAMILPVHQSPISRLLLGAKATGEDDTGSNAYLSWKCWRFGELLSIQHIQKKIYKKLCTHPSTHTMVCLCVRHRRTTSKPGSEWACADIWLTVQSWNIQVDAVLKKTSGKEVGQTMKYCSGLWHL